MRGAALVSRNEISRALEKLKLSSDDFRSAKTPNAVMNVLSELGPLAQKMVFASWPLLEKCKQPHQWGPSICEGLRLCEPEKRYEDAEGFLRTADCFMGDDELNLIDRSDATIQRKIKHLIQLKAAKQMLHQLEPKVISPKVVAI